MSYFTGYFGPYFETEGQGVTPSDLPYWAVGFWATGYWPANYWPDEPEVAQTPNNLPYWPVGYWATGYWSATYWPAASAVRVVPQQGGGTGPPDRLRPQVRAVAVAVRERRDTCRIVCAVSWAQDDEDIQFLMSDAA